MVEFIGNISTLLGFLVIGVVVLILIALLLLGIAKATVSLMRNCNEIRYGLIGYYCSKKNDDGIKHQIRIFLKHRAERKKAAKSCRKNSKHDWVKCPVCGEPDMRKEVVNEEGDCLIHCVNHACASNGGNNHSKIGIDI